jgi:hypothetical protein
MEIRVILLNRMFLLRAEVISVFGQKSVCGGHKSDPSHRKKQRREHYLKLKRYILELTVIYNEGKVK